MIKQEWEIMSQALTRTHVFTLERTGPNPRYTSGLQGGLIYFSFCVARNMYIQESKRGKKKNERNAHAACALAFYSESTKKS